MKKDICIVGIAGGSASGKTTIVNNIKELFQNDIELISHDNYYLSNDDKTMEERVKLNYDHPSSFDTDKMIEDVKKLKAGEVIYRPVYDYTKHTRAEEVVEVHPKKVIILEGILILEDPRLRDLMDIKVFVDTDADERLMRRILRDTQERGRTVESVLNQYVTTVKPMHEQFVEPSKKYADIIIPRGGENKIGIHILQEHLKLMLG
ncbi:uridine kinase [Intestinibacter bartlettii]|uniref:Uridine kinase n=1 Tax=Intestinibacter bartlettii TaxID=261299 RepID=A0ABS6DWW6_9FIRM|nr:uridine kinase [Intestinibacter bartlettii]MBU5336222.1 uridine kinase [Intestinibacter bartlettii]MDO5011703.1 uridine kinase [Intestinibacter bartlettii]